MEKKLVCFLVVGRMGKSLTHSKAEPFVVNQEISSIYIFRETAGFPIPKVSYITLPGWIIKLRPGVVSKAFRLITEPVQLIWHAVKKHPDIINGYHLIPKGINSLIAARLTGSKCILSLIGGISEIETYSRFKWFLKRLNLWALRKTDLITSKGTVMNSYLSDHGIPLSKVLVYNGSININKFCFNPSVTKDIDILFVGSFRKLKGPDRVLYILSSLKKDFPGIKACFIGQGYLFKECTKLAKSLELTENVSFPGQVEDPSEYFQRSKVLVMPSRSEGLPTSMLEAMATGCVPVVSDVGNIRDAVQHDVNGLLVTNYLDINTFAQSIRRLLSDEKLRSEIAGNGVVTVIENYSPVPQGKIVTQMIHRIFPGYVGV